LQAEVHERRRAEEAQRRSEERLQTILQNTSALIYQIDTDGRFVHVNRKWEELFHLSNEEVRGQSVYHIFPHEVARALDLNNRAVLAQGHPSEFEERLDVDDEVHVYSSVKAPLFDDDGKPCGIVGVSTDITERKRLED